MRIGVIALAAHPLLPGRDRLWEQIASQLTERFVAIGAEVTLFATADSVTSAHLVAMLSAGFERDQAIGTAQHSPVTYRRLVRNLMVTTNHRLSCPDGRRALPSVPEHDPVQHDLAVLAWDQAKSAMPRSGQ
ncbi:MAG: hypothetical protein ABI140_03035 [Jatrophihabitantaceae bacterium]